jgi:DNA-binding PadR family transcriptional regulator
MTRTSAQMSALSAGEAVLGLVVERPGSCGQLELRLQERLGSARFARGTAYRAVERLSRQGLIRPVDDAGKPAEPIVSEPAGEASVDVSYEATADGVAYFERWLGASSGMPPMREELHAKLAFCGPGDLPRMIELVREAELDCMAQLEELNARRRREHRLRARDEWGELMGLVVATGEVVWWDARLKWLVALRQYLQREGQRYGGG